MLYRADLFEPLESLTWRETRVRDRGDCILTVLWQLTHDRLVADDLHELVLDNAANLARELMWGAPGTMLAAQALLDATGDERWATAWSRSASALLASRDADGLWTQRLHGEESRGLGPPHGLVGIVAALLQGAALLPNADLRSLRERTAAILRDTAVLEDGLANWPMAAGEPLLAGDGQVRLQWDCGAPGIVTSAAPYLDEELLLAAAALVWQAGPHGPEKGSGICHGTAGNGYALLEVFERTQDEHWLERARRFAVHALAQVEQARAGRGRGRYSLWTGDVGVALFAADCLDGRARYPLLAGWD